jgi:hypothetical protein
MSAGQSVRVTGFKDWRPTTIQRKVKQEWMQLCEQVAVEQDSERMIELVRELNRMLDEKEQNDWSANNPKSALSDGVHL